ncbi:MAG: DUF1819 family protein [Deltaproteobacteria bacterium]|nr:DUF1819 family protein [Deltaproteobacteria bacterium]
MMLPTYLMSFTTGGLFYGESIKVAELYLDVRDWKKVKKRVLADNLLQTRTSSSAARIFREISSRITLLTEAQLNLLSGSARPEQNYLLWLAVCKRYSFIREFAIEVLRERFLCLEMTLSHDDYDSFYREKAQWHEELENLSPSTRKKNRSVLFRILMEAELLSPENLIIPALFTRELAAVIATDDPSFFGCYPISKRDVKELI